MFFPPPDPDHRWKIRIFLNSKRINTGEMESNLWLEMGKRWISFSLDMSHRYEPGGRVQISIRSFDRRIGWNGKQA